LNNSFTFDHFSVVTEPHPDTVNSTGVCSPGPGGLTECEHGENDWCVISNKIKR